MRSLTINAAANRYAMQCSLKSFGRFSAVDVALNDRGDVVFSEVGPIQRLKRAIIGNVQAEKASQDALLKLAEVNPAIRAALGATIVEARSWSVIELRAQLKLPAERLTVDEVSKRFRIPVDDAVGLATIRAEESYADLVIGWKVLQKNGVSDDSKLDRQNFRDGRVIVHSVEAEPKEGDLEKLYKHILEQAMGQQCQHIALSPFPDQIPTSEYHTISHSAFTDVGIECLLDAIESTKSTRKSTPRITITTDRIPGLADRIKDIQIRRKAQRESESHPEPETADMPAGLKAIKPDLENLPKADSLYNLRGSERITEFENFTLFWGDPHRLNAETMVLQYEGLQSASIQLAGKGFSTLKRVYEMMFDPQRLLGQEVKQLTDASKKRWGIEALQMPPCEIATSKLFAMNLPQGAAITADQAKKFFLVHLQNSKRKVVIQLPTDRNAQKGLLDAIRQFKESGAAKNVEIVLASAEQNTCSEFSDSLKSS